MEPYDPSIRSTEQRLLMINTQRTTPTQPTERQPPHHTPHPHYYTPQRRPRGGLGGRVRALVQAAGGLPGASLCGGGGGAAGAWLCFVWLGVGFLVFILHTQRERDKHHQRFGYILGRVMYGCVGRGRGDYLGLASLCRGRGGTCRRCRCVLACLLGFGLFFFFFFGGVRERGGNWLLVFWGAWVKGRGRNKSIDDSLSHIRLQKKQVRTLGQEQAAMEADPLFRDYMKKITDKGFFKGLEEGSKGGCLYIIYVDIYS